MSYNSDNLEVLKKYFELISAEYLVYISWDDKLEPDSKAIRKATIQSLRKLLASIQQWEEIPPEDDEEKAG